MEEDTEVVHSGAGSSYVKNEDIETDASKNAEDPIQDINNPSESDEKDREPTIHIAGTSSERKRKSSAASDASTSPKKQMKVKIDKDNSTQQSKTGFDEQCNHQFL